MFKDRVDAAKQLSEKLRSYELKNAVVVALPRGGVPIGYVIATELGLPFDIVLSKKVGHPFNKEFSIGSVSLYGQVINHTIPVSEEYLEQEIEKIRSHLKEQHRLYKRDKAPVSLDGKNIIVTDDGIATGNTILSCIDIIKKNNPAKIIVAIPVAPPETIEKIMNQVDEVVCLYTPGNFYGVGQFYEKFDQVSDETVMLLLEKFYTKKEIV